MSLSLALLLPAIIIIVFWWMIKSWKRHKLLDKIPGPPTLPLIGNAHMFSSQPVAFFADVLGMASTYGTKEGLYRIWMGSHPSVVLVSADTVETLLSNKHLITKAPEYGFLHKWLGSGLLTSTGEKWHVRRKLLTPTFHFKILHDFLTVFNEQAAVMIEEIGKAQRDTDQINIFPYITLCALDVICETAMGMKVNAQGNSDSEYIKAIYKMSELIQTRMKTPWHWPDFLFYTIGHGKETDRLIKILHDFTIKVIGDRKAEFDQLQGAKAGGSALEREILKKRPRLAFLDMLMCSKTEDGQSLTSDDIREEVDTFMFEGHDTTAAAMNWAVHLIGTDSRVQDKIHQELDKIFGSDDRPPTTDDLEQMKYLGYAIKEALRLFPSVPMFGREATQDIVIKGYTVPKGTTLVVLSYALHRDPEHFPEPETYRPERFLPDNIAGRHPFCYIPFSAGLRNCIGQKFALMEEKAILSAIFRKYTVTSTQSREQLHPMGELITRPEKGIFVKLARRV